MTSLKCAGDDDGAERLGRGRVGGELTCGGEQYEYSADALFRDGPR